MKLVTLAITLAGAFLITGCQPDAYVASKNLSKASEQFEIGRRIVFYNGITDKYILEIVGRCSIFSDGLDKQLEVTCKTGDDQYKKHFLGLSDNVTYFAEQMDPADVSVRMYRVVFKPASIVPDIDVEL